MIDAKATLPGSGPNVSLDDVRRNDFWARMSLEMKSEAESESMRAGAHAKDRYPSVRQDQIDVNQGRHYRGEPPLAFESFSPMAERSPPPPLVPVPGML